jgi:hypothetical protein
MCDQENGFGPSFPVQFRGPGYAVASSLFAILFLLLLLIRFPNLSEGCLGLLISLNM